MSEDRGHCPDCGGSDGWHYSDCIYDGTEGRGAIHSIQEAVRVVPVEKFGSSISLLSLSVMVSMSYSEPSY